MEADVVISWAFAPVPDAIKALFKRPTKFIVLPTPANRTYKSQIESFTWPYPVRTIIRQKLPGVTPLRIAALGFSESCHGVRNLLSGNDGMYLDAVIAVDGIHTQFVNKNQVDPNTMIPWINHAKYAVVNERLFVGTHSSIVPPNYASTTQTCNFIWRTLTGSDQAFTNPPMPEMSIPPTSITVAGGPSTGTARTVQYPAPAWLPPKRAGGLVIVGAKNVDGPGTADHIYQAKYVLPLVLKQFLVARWNAIDPKNPDACFVGGSGNPLGALSSSCASSFVAPASFVSPGSEPAPLPVPSTAALTGGGSNRSLWVAGALVGIGTLGLYLMHKYPKLAYKANYSPAPLAGVDPEELRIGTAVEAREHGMTRVLAEKTAREHLAEDSQYYTKLAKLEKGTPVYGWDALLKLR